MDRSLAILGLALLTFLIAVAILVIVILHRRKLHKLDDRLAEGAVDNSETLKDVVERENAATRKHVSSAVDGVRNDTKLSKQRILDMEYRQKQDATEMRGQMTSVKERLQWLIKVIDVLGDRVGDSFKVLLGRTPPPIPPIPPIEAPKDDSK